MCAGLRVTPMGMSDDEVDASSPVEIVDYDHGWAVTGS
jgi:hypothetical protein